MFAGTRNRWLLVPLLVSAVAAPAAAWIDVPFHAGTVGAWLLVSSLAGLGLLRLRVRRKRA